MDSLTALFTTYSQQSNFFYLLLIPVAFLAGVLASLSPCSLSFLPVIIGYVGGYSKENNRNIFIQMLSFSLGLSFVLSIIGILCAIFGRAFAGFSSPVLILLFASVILIMGLNLLELVEVPFPSFIKKLPQNKKGSLFFFPFFVGTLFALVSSPCASPILAAIMAIATVSTDMLFSVALLFSFALGECLIIILFAVFASALKHTKVLVKYSSLLMKISGIILILASAYIYYSVFKVFF